MPTQSAQQRAQSKTAGTLTDLPKLFSYELACMRTALQSRIQLLLQLIESDSGQALRGMQRCLLVSAVIDSDRIERLLAERADLSELQSGKGAKAGEALEKEALEAVKADQVVRDLKIISALQRILHVAIAATGTAAAHANLVGDPMAAATLRTMVKAAKRIDRQLTQISTRSRGAGEDTDFEGHLLNLLERGDSMPNYRDEERSGNGRSRSSGRDEYSGSQRSSRYDEDDDRSSRRRSSGGGYDSEERFGGGEGRSRGGRRSSEMPERDEYGQFTGSRGGSSGGSSRYDDDDDRGYSSRRSSSSSSRYDDEDDRSSRRRSGGGYDSDERFGGEEGRSRGGRHSAEMQERDEYGQFTGSRGGSSGGSSRYDDDDDDRGYSSRRRSSSSRYEDDDRRSGGGGGGGSRGGDVTDSAGRHYSRDSWERAQEGRARGGEHSHGGR